MLVLTKCCFSYLGDNFAQMAFPLLMWDTPTFHPPVLLDSLAKNSFYDISVRKRKTSRARESHMRKQAIRRGCKIYGRLLGRIASGPL